MTMDMRSGLRLLVPVLFGGVVMTSAAMVA